MAEKIKPIPSEGPKFTVEPKGSKKVISYIWMPDKNGNLVKANASTVKKAFASLPQDAVLALQEYLISVENRTNPTRAQRGALWNSVVDGAVAAFKDGKKQSPWDVLDVMEKNSPEVTGASITYTDYDQITADAFLNKIAKKIDFDTNLLTPEDRADFFNKLQTEAKASGKSVTRKAVGGGTETVITPSLFDAVDFTESYLWAKVNIGDTANIPSSAIANISGVKSLLRSYNVTKFSDMEINQLGLDLSSGAKTLDEVTTKIREESVKDYPQFATRFADNPKLTLRDAVSPIINALAQTWEVSADTIDLNDPKIERLIRPDGVLGKLPPATVAQTIEFAMNDKKFDGTVKSKTMAVDAAKGSLRAMGFGI